jgi:hypothetical protein
MKTTKGTVTLTMERYQYPRVTAPLEVPAYIVGEIAIHRQQFWGMGDAPELAPIDHRSKWMVSHVPTGSSLRVMLPPRFFDGVYVGAKKADLEQWARQVQRACPAFFDVTRDLKPGEYVPAERQNIARDALNKSQAL